MNKPKPTPTLDLGFAIARVKKCGYSLELWTPNCEEVEHQHIYIGDARPLRDWLNEQLEVQRDY